jgi:hypothetical protein
MIGSTLTRLLGVACQNGHTEVVELLLACADADVHLPILLPEMWIATMGFFLRSN